MITEEEQEYDNRFDGLCFGRTYDEEYGNEVDEYGD